MKIHIIEVGSDELGPRTC